MDNGEAGKSLSVKDVKDPSNVRLILVHLLIGLALGLNIVKTVNGNVSGLDQSEKDLDISMIVLMSVHLAIVPLNILVTLVGLDKLFVGASVDEKKGEDKELVSLTRLPLVRQLVAGVILSGSAYVLGAMYNRGGSGEGAHALTYAVPALVLYSAADSLGRNYL
jgi:hypothetical protein